MTDGFFDVLQYGYLPFDEIPFDTNYFNAERFRLPSEYFLEEVAPVSARDDYDDSKSTHPNLKKRRERTSELLANYKGGSYYVMTDEQTFSQIRTLARLECIRQNLIYANYVRAFYDCYVMERDFPNNHFLAVSRAQALYSLAKHKTATNTASLVPDYKDYEGEVQQPYHLFRKMKNDELALVAMREIWKAHLMFPADAQLMAMAKDVLGDICTEYKLDYAAFARNYDTTLVEVDTTRTASRNQKYERIRQKRQNQNRTDMRRYAFVDFLSTDTGLEVLMQELGRPVEAAETDYQGKGMITYCPTYLVLNQKNDKIEIGKSSRGEESEVERMAQAAKAAKLKPMDFSDVHLRNCSTAEEYNEFVSVGEWCAEYSQGHGNVEWNLFLQPQMEQVCQRHNMDMVCIHLVLNSEHEGTKGNAVSVLCSVVLFPLLPYSIYSIFAGSQHTLSYTLCVDAHTGKLLHRAANVYNTQDSPALLKGALYDAMRKAITKNKKD